MSVSERKQQFIEKAKSINGNKYDYSAVKYVNSQTKVTIICNKHKNTFEQTPNHHLFGRQCPKCAILSSSNKRKLTTKLFIEKSINIHGNKYDYSKTDYIDNRTILTVTCKNHKEDINVTPKEHYKPTIKCNKCRSESPNKRASTTKQFIEKANNVHNDTYDYSKSKFTGAKHKLTIICKIHGEFEQAPDKHLRGRGCSKCNGGIKLTTTEFIEKANKIHNNKYDYSHVVYKKARVKIKIRCKKHGYFEQTPNDHLSGCTCPKCASESMQNKMSLTTDEFIKRSQKIHGNKYDYSRTDYYNEFTKVIIICKEHGEFHQQPVTHYISYGCYKCGLCPSCNIWKSKGKLCEYCKPHDQNKYYMKTKELDIVRYIRENILDHDFMHNISVGSECTGGHLFPDIRFDCNTYYLIVEVDEFQHRGAGYKCDKQRMYDIIAKLGMPCIFIRYNPDNKNSSKRILLDEIKNCLDIVIDDAQWDDYGLLVKYLFYKNK